MCLTPRLCSFDLIPGVELVMQETRFDEHLAHADLVITGEGQVDAQTAFGKTALGVARRAAAAGVPCLAVGGSVTPEGAAVMVAEGAVAMPVLDRPMTLGEAMNDVSSLVIAGGERLARIVAIGGAAGVRSLRARRRRPGTPPVRVRPSRPPGAGPSRRPPAAGKEPPRPCPIAPRPPGRGKGTAGRAAPPRSHEPDRL